MSSRHLHRRSRFARSATRASVGLGAVVVVAALGMASASAETNVGIGAKGFGTNKVLCEKYNGILQNDEKTFEKQVSAGNISGAIKADDTQRADTQAAIDAGCGVTMA